MAFPVASVPGRHDLSTGPGYPGPARTVIGHDHRPVRAEDLGE
jgi:hypothetical protein